MFKCVCVCVVSVLLASTLLFVIGDEWHRQFEQHVRYERRFAQNRRQRLCFSESSVRETDMTERCAQDTELLAHSANYWATKRTQAYVYEAAMSFWLSIQPNTSTKVLIGTAGFSFSLLACFVAVCFTDWSSNLRRKKEIAFEKKII